MLSDKDGMVTDVVLMGIFSLLRKLKAREGKKVVKEKAPMAAALSR